MPPVDLPGDVPADTPADPSRAGTLADNRADDRAASAAQAAERRDYFRVEDRLVLRYCPVPAEQVSLRPAENHFDNSEVFGLMHELRAVDHENNNLLRGLAEQNRELGLYLKGVNRKIELVANALAALDNVQQGKLPQSVSLSEGGIAFVADSPLPIGSTIALELILLPQYAGLALYAEIIDNRDEAPGRTAAVFLRLREGDRQILARHIMQVQITAKRQNRAP